MAKKPLKLRELLQKLSGYGVVAMAPYRGKGSEIILLKPDEPGSTRGPQYPIKNHGPGTEISIPVINAILRRFEINASTFWS
jgi:hypothetical protein